MNETDLVSLRISPSANSHLPESPVEPAVRSRLPRPSVVAFMSILLLAIGWGGWNYFHSPGGVNDAESIADLDGFEFDAPIYGAPSKVDPASPALDSAGPLLGVPDTRNDRPFGSVRLDSPKDGFATNETHLSSDVWLTGTIEEEEPAAPIKNFPRVSGGLSDVSIIR